MKPEEWYESTDPSELIRYAQHTTGDAELRMFACACVRRIWSLISDDSAKRAVKLAEAVAKGRADASALIAARADMDEAEREAGFREWSAEAEAEFTYTPEYCRVLAALFAVRAAQQTVSVSVTVPDGQCLLPDNSAHHWAQAAVACMARAAALEAIGDHKAPGAQQDASAAYEAALVSERCAQAHLLRQLIDGPRAAKL
jgi:hypothetical protein